MEEYSVYTLDGAGPLCELRSAIQISPCNTDADGKGMLPSSEEYIGIWDTGATGSCISTVLAKRLGLTSTGAETISTANGDAIAETYVVDVLLPNSVLVRDLVVAASNMSEDMLLGMDIIGMGDFAVTNYQNRTVMSFRIPSARTIDFNEEI